MDSQRSCHKFEQSVRHNVGKANRFFSNALRIVDCSVMSETQSENASLVCSEAPIMLWN